MDEINSIFEDVLHDYHLVKEFLRCAVEYIQGLVGIFPPFSQVSFSEACTRSNDESLKT
jgi:hypothetical protein